MRDLIVKGTIDNNIEFGVNIKNKVNFYVNLIQSSKNFKTAAREIEYWKKLAREIEPNTKDMVNYLLFMAASAVGDFLSADQL